MCLGLSTTTPRTSGTLARRHTDTRVEVRRIFHLLHRAIENLTSSGPIRVPIRVMEGPEERRGAGEAPQGQRPTPTAFRQLGGKPREPGALLLRGPLRHARFVPLRSMRQAKLPSVGFCVEYPRAAWSFSRTAVANLGESYYSLKPPSDFSSYALRSFPSRPAAYSKQDSTNRALVVC